MLHALPRGLRMGVAHAHMPMGGDAANHQRSRGAEQHRAKLGTLDLGLDLVRHLNSPRQVCGAERRCRE
jgi:hypothetical protein